MLHISKHISGWVQGFFPGMLKGSFCRTYWEVHRSPTRQANPNKFIQGSYGSRMQLVPWQFPLCLDCGLCPQKVARLETEINWCISLGSKYAMHVECYWNNHLPSLNQRNNGESMNQWMVSWSISTWCSMTPTALAEILAQHSIGFHYTNLGSNRILGHVICSLPAEEHSALIFAYRLLNIPLVVQQI